MISNLHVILNQIVLTSVIYFLVPLSYIHVGVLLFIGWRPDTEGVTHSLPERAVFYHINEQEDPH